MAKKRQQDFTKTQLKPGRSLGKRKNVTNTSFKAKKIVVPKKRDSTQKSECTISECLKSIKSGFPAARITALNHLNNLVDQQESFLPYIGEVLESVAKLLLEVDNDIRNNASKIMHTIFKSSDSETFKKLSSFSALLTNILSCGMTNSVFRIKENTLIILYSILNYHPDLICNSLVILKNFLHMIVFGSPRKWSHSQSSKARSSLPIVYDDHVSSGNWRITVLKHMKLFLKEMLRNFETDTIVEEENDEQEVYWNCEGPLHLEVYAGGGLKPVDIEKSLANCLNCQELNFDDPSIIDDFIIPVVTLIPEIFREETAGQSKVDDSHLHINTIRNLSILLQVLCHLTEWIQLMSSDEVDKIISNFLHVNIYGRNLFPFHPSGVFSSKNKCTEAVELNLAVCFLHGKFLLQAEDSKDKFTTSIISYVKSVFRMPGEIKLNSVTMLVKILKMYYSLTHIDEVSEFIVDSLCHLSSLLPNADDLNKDVLLSLFMKLSLHPAYDFLTETAAMKNWFNWLLIQLTDIPKSGEVNKNLLRITKKIANRKYPHFLQALATIDNNEYIAALKYDNPDVRDTVIFLIYNMEDISGSLLEDISNVILLDSSFPVQYAIRLIRLLICRFTEEHQSTETDSDPSSFRIGRIDFIQFLLNIAVDSLNMSNEKWSDYDANEYAKAMEPFKDITVYNIFPSLHWKEHSKLFQVCEKSLSLLPQKLVSSVTVLMFKEILDHTRSLPMHCAIAILKLNNYQVKDRHYRFQIQDLIFSSLLTTSILTRMSTEDEWYKYNVVELMDSMELTRRIALETLQRQLERVDEIEGVAVYYILRILKFYLERQLFKSEDGERVFNILEGFKEKCSDKTFKQQPLFIQLYDIFYIYA